MLIMEIVSIVELLGSRMQLLKLYNRLDSWEQKKVGLSKYGLLWLGFFKRTSFSLESIRMIRY